MGGFRGSPAQKWIEKALQDLDLADRAMQPPRLPALACFHAQQAAEKALKSVAARLGAGNVPKTHNLLELADIIRQRGGTVPFPDHQLAELIPYAVEARYPGGPEPSVPAAARALHIAHEIVRWAQNLVT